MMCILLLALISSSLAGPDGKYFERIFEIVFENTGLQSTLAEPNFQALAKQGRLFTNYFGTHHPSQPNYIAIVSGSNLNVPDNNRYNITERGLFDQLEDRQVSWKVYQELYPGNCFLGAVAGPRNKYCRKHNPAISFLSVNSNPERCAKVVPSEQLDEDLRTGNLPQYGFYTPDLDNDAHDTGISFAGNYLKNFLLPRIQLFPKNTLIVISFDEDDFRENNKIYHLFLGSYITPGLTDNTYHTHYSMLRTIQDNWDLGTLGRGDSTASIMSLGPRPSSEEPTAQPTDQGQTAQPTDQGQTAQPTDQGQTAQPTDQGQTAQPTDQGQTAQPTDAATNSPTNAPTRDTTPVDVTWSFIDKRTRTNDDVKAILAGILKASTVVALSQSANGDEWVARVDQTDVSTTNLQEAEALANYLRGSSFIGTVDIDNVLLNGQRGPSNRGAVIALAVVLSLVAVVIIVLIIIAVVYFMKQKSDAPPTDYNMY